MAAAVVMSVGTAAALAQSSTSSSSTSNDTNYNNSSNMSGSNSGTEAQSANSDMSHNDSAASSSSSKKLSWGDRHFVRKAADDGQEEVAIAQLAAEKATNPDVKQFAQQMVQEHTQVNQQLMSLANSKDLKIDQEDSTKERAYRRLNKTSGNDFDREFIDRMVDDHEKDIKLFEKAAKDAKDPEVRQFASSTLDQLRQHLQHVQQLQQSVIPTGRENDNSGRFNATGSSSSTTSTGATSESSSLSGTSGSSSSTGMSSGTSSTATSSTR